MPAPFTPPIPPLTAAVAAGPARAVVAAGPLRLLAAPASARTAEAIPNPRPVVRVIR